MNESMPSLATVRKEKIKIEDPFRGKKVLLAILDLGGTADNRNIAKHLKTDSNGVASALWYLKKTGKVATVSFGKYQLTPAGKADAAQWAADPRSSEYGTPASVPGQKWLPVSLPAKVPAPDPKPLETTPAIQPKPADDWKELFMRAHDEIVTIAKLLASNRKEG